MRLLAFLFAGVASAAFASPWSGLDNRLSGADVSEGDLVGKVVLVDYWSTTVQPSRNVQPRVEKIWQSFRSKPFRVIGSVADGSAEEVEAFCKKNGITVPMFAGVTYLGKGAGRALPFFVVVDAHGRVAYSGGSDRDATEALENAIVSASLPFSLAGNHVFGKKDPYRSLEKQLVLGKPVKSIVTRLQGDAKKAQLKSATAAQRAKAAEAEELLAAIRASVPAIRSDIDARLACDPAGALKLIREFKVSFPDEAAQYKEKAAEIESRLKQERKEKTECKGKSRK